MFGGVNTRIKRFYCDKEGGLIDACKHFGITYRIAQPGRPVTNSIAERANQDVLQGARCLLEQAGLPKCFWPFAAPYYCLMESLTYNNQGESIYKKWTGRSFEAKIIPFGALVKYIVPDTRKHEQPGKWGGKGTPGVFAGYELGENGVWNGKYLIWNLSDFDGVNLAKDVYAGTLKVQKPNRMSTVTFNPDEFTFPLRAEYVRKKIGRAHV